MRQGGGYRAKKHDNLKAYKVLSSIEEHFL